MQGKMGARQKKFILLDKKGRLFGKFDIFFVLFGLVILALVVLGLRIVLEKETYVDVELFASGGEWWWNIPDPPYWLTDPVQKGAIEYDPQGRKLVEVLDTVKFESGERKRLWVKARLLVTGSKKSGKYRFRQEPLEIGQVIYIAPNNIRINCNVMWVEGVESYREESEKIITLLVEDKPLWYVDSIKVGDVMKDDEGKIIAEVLSKKVEPGELIKWNVEDWDIKSGGEVQARLNPERKNITLEVKMKTIKSRNRDYFSYFQPLKIGFWIWIPFEHMNVNGTIIDVD
jgi:hypothetical protein